MKKILEGIWDTTEQNGNVYLPEYRAGKSLEQQFRWVRDSNGYLHVISTNYGSYPDLTYRNNILSTQFKVNKSYVDLSYCSGPTDRYDIAVGSDDMLYVVYIDNYSGYALTVETLQAGEGPGGWNKAAEDDQFFSGSDMKPSIQVTPDGVIHICCYKDQVGLDRAELWYMYKSGGVWSSPVKVLTEYDYPATLDQGGVFQMLDNDHGIFISNANRSGGKPLTSIYYHEGTWRSAQSFGDLNGYYPSFYVDGSTVHCINWVSGNLYHIAGTIGATDIIWDANYNLLAEDVLYTYGGHNSRLIIHVDDSGNVILPCRRDATYERAYLIGDWTGMDIVEFEDQSMYNHQIVGYEDGVYIEYLCKTTSSYLGKLYYNKLYF